MYIREFVFKAFDYVGTGKVFYHIRHLVASNGEVLHKCKFVSK